MWRMLNLVNANKTHPMAVSYMMYWTDPADIGICTAYNSKTDLSKSFVK